MVTSLAIACGVIACACIALAVLYAKSNSDRRRLRTELDRFAEITDLEMHAKEQVARAEVAVAQLSKTRIEIERLGTEIATSNATVVSLNSELETQRHALTTVAQALGDYQTLAELRTQIA